MGPFACYTIIRNTEQEDSMANRWTEEEIAILREHYRTKGVKWCAAQLPNHPAWSIEGKVRQLKMELRPRAKWEQWELDLLAEHFPGKGVKWCAARIPNHTEASIAKKVQDLGLRLDVTASRIFSGAKRDPLPTGIMRTFNGYLCERAGGSTRALHRKAMEELLGRPLDSREIVHHIDGDKHNNAIENLQIVTRAEHMALHREDIHRRKRHSPTLRETGEGVAHPEQ